MLEYVMKAKDMYPKLNIDNYIDCQFRIPKEGERYIAIYSTDSNIFTEIADNYMYSPRIIVSSPLDNLELTIKVEDIYPTVVIIPSDYHLVGFRLTKPGDLYISTDNNIHMMNSDLSHKLPGLIIEKKNKMSTKLEVDK